MPPFEPLGRRTWSGKHLLPADSLHAGYNLLIAGLWASRLSRASIATPLCVCHVVAAGLPLLIRRASARLASPVAVLREYYALLWLAAYWLELDWLIQLLHRDSHDAAILRLEHPLIAGAWQAEAVTHPPSWMVNETMYLLYASYLPLLVVTPIALGIAGRQDILREFSFRVSLVALCCFSIYLAWPVAGPAYGATGLPSVTGVVSGGIRFIRGLTDSKGTAFPSSHVAIATTICLVGWRWLPRCPAIALTVLVAGIAIACVYTRNHYLVDAAAGVLLALLLQPVGGKLRANWSSMVSDLGNG